MNGEQETSGDVTPTSHAPAPTREVGTARQGASSPSVVPRMLRVAIPGQRRVDETKAARLVERHGSLTSFSGQRDRAVPAARINTPTVVLASEPGSAASVDAALERARTALGVMTGTGLVEHTVVVRVEIDVDGRLASTTQRTGWRAIREGARSFVVSEVVDVPVEARPVIEALEGCAVGRSYTDLRDGVFVSLIDLRAPLSSGVDVGAWTLHRILPGAVGQLATCHEHRLDGPVGEIRLEVVFDPRCVPSSGGAYVTTSKGEVCSPLPVHEGSLVWSGTATDACVVGLRWVW